MSQMITALLYKDATARILQVACALAACWMALVYTVAALPISLDTSGVNPLNAESSMTLASQATAIIAAALANVELGSGESAMTAIIADSRPRMAAVLVTSKTIIILTATLLLTLADAVADALVYGSGRGLGLACQYAMLTAMNGIAVLALSSVAGNVLLGLSIYFLTPILLKPFIISLAPSANSLIYSTVIKSMNVNRGSMYRVPILSAWACIFILSLTISEIKRKK